MSLYTAPGRLSLARPDALSSCPKAPMSAETPLLKTSSTHWAFGLCSTEAILCTDWEPALHPAVLSHRPLLTFWMCTGLGAGSQPITKCIKVTSVELVMEVASPKSASCRKAPVTSASVLPAGLGAGGQPVANCRKAFITSVELLVELASLQTAFITLDIAIKQTNRRVNALDNVVRPRLENTIAYIKVYPCLHRWTVPA